MNENKNLKKNNMLLSNIEIMNQNNEMENMKIGMLFTLAKEQGLPRGVIKRKKVNRQQLIDFINGDIVYITPEPIRLIRQNNYKELLNKAHKAGFKAGRRGKPSKDILAQYIINNEEAKNALKRVKAKAQIRTHGVQMKTVTKQLNKTRNVGIIQKFMRNANKRIILLNSKTTVSYLKNMKLSLTVDNKKVNKKYGTEELTVRLKTPVFFGNQEDNKVPMNIIEIFIEKIIAILDNYNVLDNDQVKFYFSAINKQPVNLPFVYRKNLSANDIAESIMNILNSNEYLDISELDFGFVIVRQPKGGANYIATNIEDYTNKRCFIQIKNTDNSCFVMALAVMIEHLKMKKGEITENAFKTFKQGVCGNRNKYIKICQKLYTLVGMEINTQVSFGDIIKFEEALQVTINVLDFKQCIYPYNLEDQYEDQVYLHFHNNHYNCITSPEAFYNLADIGGVMSFCNGCKKCVNKTSHICQGNTLLSSCIKCGSKHSSVEDIDIICHDCNRNFTNSVCLNKHKGKTCKKLKVCTDCGVLVYNVDKT
jgi:hypothetical protein